MESLKHRFGEFCRTYPGAEEIDSIVLSPEHKAKKLQKADFFFESRLIICEVKALQKDTSEKLEEMMAYQGIHPSTLAMGEHIIEEVFKKLTKGGNLYNKAIKAITKPVDKAFADAACQIRDTKKLFNIPSADGLFVILNDVVPIFGQTLVEERLRLALKKKNQHGEPYHSHVTRVLYINETNAVETIEGDKRVNTTYSVNPEAHGVLQFTEKFASAWAIFCGHEFETAGPQIDELMRTSKLFVKVE